MANNGRTAERAVGSADALGGELITQDFFQVLRRIECAASDKPRLGRALDPALEPVRMGQSPSLAFPSSAIVSDEQPGGDRPRRLGVSFFGLFGPNGPMPLHLSDYVYQRLHRHRDRTLVRFADTFHHRLLLLLYRAWAYAQPTVSADRSMDDSYARHVGALIGQHEEPAALTRPDLCALGLARHFLGHTRHPEGLSKVLGQLFDTPARIEEFVAEWLRIPDEYCWRLSSSGDAAGLGQLGTSTRVGTEVLERRFKFRIQLGPMRQRAYERFLPGGEAMPQLVAMVQRYLGHELTWDVSLLVAEPDAQGAVLGRSGRLGQTSHLGASGSQRAPSTRTVVLDPLARAS